MRQRLIRCYTNLLRALSLTEPSSVLGNSAAPGGGDVTWTTQRTQLICFPNVYHKRTSPPRTIHTYYELLRLELRILLRVLESSKPILKAFGVWVPPHLSLDQMSSETPSLGEMTSKGIWMGPPWTALKWVRITHISCLPWTDLEIRGRNLCQNASWLR